MSQHSHNLGLRLDAAVDDGERHPPRPLPNDVFLLPATNLVSETLYSPSSRPRRQMGSLMNAPQRRFRTQSSVVGSARRRSSAKSGLPAVAPAAPHLYDRQRNSTEEMCAGEVLREAGQDRDSAISRSNALDTANEVDSRLPLRNYGDAARRSPVLPETASASPPPKHNGGHISIDPSMQQKRLATKTPLIGSLLSTSHESLITLNGGSSVVAHAASHSFQSQSRLSSERECDSPVIVAVPPNSDAGGSITSSNVDAVQARWEPKLLTRAPSSQFGPPKSHTSPSLPPKALLPPATGYSASLPPARPISPPDRSCHSSYSIGGLQRRSHAPSGAPIAAWNLVLPPRGSTDELTETAGTLCNSEAVRKEPDSPSRVALSPPSSGSHPLREKQGAAATKEASATPLAESVSPSLTDPPASLRFQPHPPWKLRAPRQSGVAPSVVSADSTSSNPENEVCSIIQLQLPLSPPCLAEDPPPALKLHRSPIPLRNFGSTCYLNSIVQCLLSTHGLIHALNVDRHRIVRQWEKEPRHEARRCPSNQHRRIYAERTAPVTSSLIDLATAHPASPIPVSQLLLSLKAACAECNDEFSSNGQNDAHEFLITLLGVLDKEVRRSEPANYEAVKDIEEEGKRDAYARWVTRIQKDNDSTVYDYFGGITGCTLKCSGCGLLSYRFAALLDVSLPMAYRTDSTNGKAASTVAETRSERKVRRDGAVAVDPLIREMFFSDRGEFLSGSMQTTCDRCKKLRDKTIWWSMEQWPYILVLHLKRFNNAGVKNEAAVVFPYTFSPFSHVRYQLYGVCCHRGKSSFGHYTSYTYVESDDNGTATAAGPRTTTSTSPSSSQLESPQSLVKTGGHTSSVSSMHISGLSAGGCSGGFVTPDRSTTENESRSTGKPSSNGPGPVGGNSGGEGQTDSAGAGTGCSTSTKTGRWFLCNDDTITEAPASNVASMTKEAYILFYRRIDPNAHPTYNQTSSTVAEGDRREKP